MIMAGEVRVGEEMVSKPGTQVSAQATITVIQGPPFVSRGGLKLAAALKAFDIHINLVLENAEFTDEDVEKKFPRVFLRGDMILFVV